VLTGRYKLYSKGFTLPEVEIVIKQVEQSREAA
jgi:hypothetical protein